ncbi:MAG: hypothetical protein GX989_07290 [Firmicutes bacterium]|nr:hypothetical protein [Bacillota bacterium]
MKINPVSTVNTAIGAGKASDSNREKTPLNNKAENAVDKFVPSEDKFKKVVTYNKKAVKTDDSFMAALQEESEKAYESLKRIIVELLERQGYSAQRVKDERPGAFEVEIDETARTEAAALIADDGPLGAEAVSNRIVDFAIAASGGDRSKLSEIKSAIDEGFRQAKNMLGGLPEVSLKTYDLIMEKLDRWGEEEP